MRQPEVRPTPTSIPTLPHPAPGAVLSLPLVYNWILNERENKVGKGHKGAQQPLDPPLCGALAGH